LHWSRRNIWKMNLRFSQWRLWRDLGCSITQFGKGWCFRGTYCSTDCLLRILLDDEHVGDMFLWRWFPPTPKLDGTRTQKNVLFKCTEVSFSATWCHNPKDFTVNITVHKSTQKLQANALLYSSVLHFTSLFPYGNTATEQRMPMNFCNTQYNTIFQKILAKWKFRIILRLNHTAAFNLARSSAFGN
jgi:hypothetical protein